MKVGRSSIVTGDAKPTRAQRVAQLRAAHPGVKIVELAAEQAAARRKQAAARRAVSTRKPAGSVGTQPKEPRMTTKTQKPSARRSVDSMTAEERNARMIELGLAPAATLRGRIEQAPAFRDLRDRGRVLRVGESFDAYTREEFAAVLTRTTVTDATGAPTPQQLKASVLNPSPGGRIAPLLTWVPQPEAEVALGEEGDVTTETTGPHDYGVALDQLNAKFTKVIVPDSRFGGFTLGTKSVFADSKVLTDAVNSILHRQIERQLDHEVTDGDGSGTLYGRHLVGLAHSSLPTRDCTALGDGSIWQSILAAAGTVRAADFQGDIAVVLNMQDATDLATEGTSTGAPTLADALQAGELLGVKKYVFSNVIAQGTGYVASFGEIGSGYVREAPAIEIAYAHDTGFVTGVVAVKVECRLGLRISYPTAGVQLVNIGS